jgi:hypothetical protein
VLSVLTLKTARRGAINPLSAELNPIFHLLALLGAHHIFHVSGLRVKGHFLIDVLGAFMFSE